MKNLIIIFALLLPINLLAKPLLMDLDGAMFKNDKETNIWELYYSFADTTIAYKVEDGKYIGELLFDLKFYRGKEIIKQDKWIVTYSPDEFPAKFKMNLVGQKTFILPKENLNAKIEIKDLNNPETKAEAEFLINTRNFPEDRVTISDLQLAQAVEKVSEAKQVWNSAFKKNNLFVVPNPSLELISNNPFLNLYCEIYQAKSVSPNGFLIEYSIYDGANRQQLFLPQKRISAADALVETISIPLDVLPSGVYFIQAKLKYPIEKAIDSNIVRKKFYLMNPDMPPLLQANFTEDQLFEMSEFSTMTEEEISKEFEKVLYNATEDEVAVYKKLTTTEAKQKFMFTFWYVRDPDRNTAINEALEEHRKKIDYCNNYFSYGKFKEGWKSDRGRILLRYGFPTVRNTVPPAFDHRPYEEWYYDNVQGGVRFYFVDMSGYGDFYLVHSTAIGELQNENWYNEFVIPNDPNALQRRFDNNWQNQPGPR